MPIHMAVSFTADAPYYTVLVSLAGGLTESVTISREQFYGAFGLILERPQE